MNYPFRENLKRLHRLWCEWDSYTRLGGPVETPLVEMRALKADLIALVADSRSSRKDQWLATIEAACGPSPERKPYSMVNRAAKSAERAARMDTISRERKIPMWRGPNDDGPPRKVVGVVWYPKAERWAIRIKTKVGEYFFTQTEGVSLFDLAYIVDHMKCVLMVGGVVDDPAAPDGWREVGGGYFSTRSKFMRKAAWNDYECAKEKIECGGLSLNTDNPQFAPLYADLAEWTKRLGQRDHDRGRGFHDTTLRDIPKERALLKSLDARAPKGSYSPS